jgi:surface antigen
MMMRSHWIAAALAGALALGACETTGGGYGGGGYGQSSGYGRGTQLSRCMQQALIGAGVGAVVGAVTAPEGNRGENAAIGAAVGAAGTYGVCRWLSARERQRVEQAYYQSLNTNAPVNDSWRGDQGQPRDLTVARPAPVQGPSGECRRVSGVVTDPQYGQQTLPPETFCRTPSGAWGPA